jgi:hypothetical protein
VFQAAATRQRTPAGQTVTPFSQFVVDANLPLVVQEFYMAELFPAGPLFELA